MAKETEYRSETRPPDHNWFARSSLFTIQAAGIGFAAYKMGGPHGKLLDKFKDQLTQKSAISSYESWIRKKPDLFDIAGFQGKIPTGLPGEKSIIKSSSIPTIDELSEWGRQEFNIGILTPTSIINESIRLEADIQSFLEGDIDGHSIDSLKKLDIYSKHTFSKNTGQPEVAKDIIVTKLKLEVLKEHAGSQSRYIEGAPLIDITDPIFSEDPYANRQNIDELHKFTMENDKMYANKYKDSVKKVVREFKMDTVPKVLSDPTIKSKTIDGTIIPSSRLTSKLYGSVEDQIRKMGGITALVPDKSSILYQNDTSIPISRNIVEKNLQKNIDATGLNLQYSQYLPQLKKISGELERLKTMYPDDISETFLKDIKISTSEGLKKKYVIMGIRRRLKNAKDYLIELPIPIADNGLVPNISSIEGAVHAEVKYVTGQAHRISDAHAVNSTQNYFEQVYKMINDVRSHGIIEQSPQKWENDMLSQLRATQGRTTPLYGEQRDFMRSHQVRMFSYEQFLNTTPARRRSRLEALKTGLSSIKAMKHAKEKGKKQRIVVIDLETVNLDAKSVQFTPTDPTTGIWQFGMVEANSKGQIMHAEKATSDHIFRENRILADELKQKGTLKTVLNSNTAEAQRLRGFANFTKKITGLKDDYDSLTAFMNDVKSQAATSRQTVFKNRTSINNSKDFARYIKNRMKDVITNASKVGEEVVFVTANGLDFDLKLLETLTGDSGGIRSMAANVDVQKYTKAMTTGMYDAPSVSLNNMMDYWMNKTGSKGSSLVSFDHDPGEYLKSLSRDGHISLVPSKRRTLTEYLQGKLGKRHIAHDALTDSVATLGLFQMIRNFHDKDDFFVLRDMEGFINRMEGNDSQENIKRFLELEGMTLPDNLGEFSFSVTSSSGAAKMIGTNLNSAHMYPILSSNPPGRNLSQQGRSVWIRKDTINTKNRDWMTRNKLNEHMVLRADDMLHRRANWTQNRLVNKMQFHTAYMIDKWGSNQGLNLITKDALEFTTVNAELVALRDIPDNAQVANGITDMYKATQQRAKELAKEKQVNFDVDGGQMSADIWNQAARDVRANIEKFGALPSLDPNNPITITTKEGGVTRAFNNKYPGKITEIVANARPGTKEGPISFYARIMLEASGENLNTAIINDAGTNALTHMLNIKSTEIAYGKHGLKHPIQRWSNFDFMSKGMWGSLRQSMLKKGWQIAQDIKHRTKGKDLISYNNANSALEKFAGMLKSTIGYYENKDGTTTFGPRDMSMKADEILKQQSRISVTDIFDAYSAAGHEATFNKQQMESWYGYFGNDMWEGRKKIRKDMANMLIGLRSQARGIKKSTDQVAMIRQQADLIRHMDPLSITEMKLRKRGLLKGTIDQKMWDRDPLTMSKHIEDTRVPIYMQIAPDPDDPTGYGRPAYVAPSEVNFYNKPWDVPTYKKKIKLRRAYYDQLMLKGNHFSNSTKEMLENTVGWKKEPKLWEVSNSYNKLREGMTNMLVAKSFTSDHELTYNQISELISRKDTTDRIERDLRALNQGSNPEALGKVSKAIKEIGDNLHEYGEEELEDAVTEGIGLMNLGKKEFLEQMKHRPNWLHVHEIKNQHSMLADQKKGLWWLPAKFRRLEGDEWKTYGKNFEFNLDNFINELNSSHTSKDPIKKEAFLSFFNAVEEGNIYKGAKSTENMLSVRQLDNGKHVVSMAGFLLPANVYAENIAHQVKDGYGPKTDQMRAVSDVQEAYHIYQKETIKGRQAEGKWHQASKQYLMLLQHTMSPVKGSPIFNANNTVNPTGFEMTYHTVDHALNKSHGILRELESGTHSGQLKTFLGQNKGWTVKRLRSHLKSITDMKLNTMVALKSSIFNGDMMMQFANGNATGLMEEVAKSERLKKEVRKISSGRETLPGATFFRYPLAPEGSIPGHEGPLLVTPDEVGKMIGLDKNKIYGLEGIGNMLKADNDNDKGYVILKGFSTVEEMDILRKEQKGVLEKYKTLPEMQGFYDSFNNSQYVSSTFERGGKRYAKIPRIDYNNTGQIVLDEIKMSELSMYKKDDKFRLGGMVQKNMSYAAQLGNSSKAMERHIQTNALGAYSKTQIGLWNNTITQRIHELFMGNPGLVKNSTEVFSMLGSLDHGLGNLIQQAAIAPVKHGDISMAYQMSDMYKLWNDPARASAEQYKNGRDWWIKQTDGQPAAIREKAGSDFDIIMQRTSTLSKAKQYDPRLAKFIKHEHGNMLGKSGFTFMDWAMYSMFDQGKINNTLSNTMQAAMQSIEPGSHGAQLNMLSDVLQDTYSKSTLERLSTKKFRSVIPDMMHPMKRAGKWAGIGALAYLGMNFFRPNTMSNSYSPLDGFTNLGTDIEGENNMFLSDMELPRHLPLDMVNASFSKAAYIEMNDNRYAYKEGQSNYLNSVLENSTIGGYYQSNMHQFKSRPNTTYSNRKSRIGPFGSSELERRSNMV